MKDFLVNAESLILNGITNDKFLSYHKANQEIYNKFKEYSFATLQKGHKRYSAKGIFEIIRWHTGVNGSDKYKINNNYTPYYARMVMNEHPNLFKDFFKLRVTKN
jgi:hypothetical protein